MAQLNSLFTNPTGLGIRSDSEGGGRFGDRRGPTRVHDGLDVVCVPGQKVLSPISGVFTRIVYPYASDLSWSGVEIKNEDFWIWMFYIDPRRSLLKTYVLAGDVIGAAQDISRKYGAAMTPHIHLQVRRISPLMFFKENL